MLDSGQFERLLPAWGPRRIGPYQILASLGSGGMGTVYKATDERTSETVALKVLHNHLLFAPGALERFRREILVLRGLKHEYVVGFREFGDHEGVPYLVMDYVAGAPLSRVVEALAGRPVETLGERALLAACGGAEDREASSVERKAQESQDAPRPTPTRSTLCSHVPERSYFEAVARIGLTLARAVDYLHGKGITHRDIKPSNVILRPDGSPVLMDLGIARAPGDVTVTSSLQVVGTRRYMAPERSGEPGPVADPQSDLYELGATLYELAYLDPIFAQYGDETELLAAKRREDPVPRRRAPAPPRALESVLLKCLARDRGQRYRSALEVAGDLQRLLDSPALRAAVERQASSVERRE